MEQNNKIEFVINREKCEITVMRTFSAPRPMIWAAMTDPALTVLWWGPAKYKTTVEKFDFRPGGEWRFVQRDEALRRDYVFYGITKEIVPLERIAQTFNFEGAGPGHELVQTQTLEDVEGGTKMTAHIQYQNIQDLEGMVQTGMEGGQRESYERLAELVRPKKELTIVRIFDAPRELVWKAWTDPAFLMKWWGPTMFTAPECNLDVRPGGVMHIVMEGPGNMGRSAMNGTFKEVQAPEKLVFASVVSFTGNDAEPDIENLNTVTFEEEGSGKTKMTLHVQVVKSTPAAEGPLSGQEMGWRQSLEKLAGVV